MSKYKVLWVADENNRRGYRDRQLYANEYGVMFYMELHYNASAYDQPGMEDNPCSVIVADNSSAKTRNIAGRLSDLVSQEWGFPKRGVDVVGSERNGYYNVVYANAQSILTECLYVSDKEQADIAMSESGIWRLAELHVQVIREFYPEGGTMALSIGHMFKPAPHEGDKGAPVVGQDYKDCAEADLALRLGKAIETLLTGEGVVPEKPRPNKALDVIANGLEMVAKGVRMFK